MPNVRGMEFPYTPAGIEDAASVQRGSDMSAVKEFESLGRPTGPAYDPRMTGATGQMLSTEGVQDRLSQLLEAREMIDQEIASIIGVPPGTENLDMLPPPPMDPMAQMPPGAMGAPNGMPGGPPMQGGPPVGPRMPPMGPQGLLGM
jgi:hypothetical protein